MVQDMGNTCREVGSVFQGDWVGVKGGGVLAQPTIGVATEASNVKTQSLRRIVISPRRGSVIVTARQTPLVAVFAEYHT